MTGRTKSSAAAAKVGAEACCGHIPGCIGSGSFLRSEWQAEVRRTVRILELPHNPVRAVGPHPVRERLIITVNLLGCEDHLPQAPQAQDVCGV